MKQNSILKKINFSFYYPNSDYSDVITGIPIYVLFYDPYTKIL